MNTTLITILPEFYRVSNKRSAEFEEMLLFRYQQRAAEYIEDCQVLLPIRSSWFNNLPGLFLFFTLF